ncbi:substrate-binding periplasmic protein [Dongshaea marina]|uniref:substrate-binding periplasmic protein n=1 Tax=Dongshaea marina TaxID=2047966 RepID=UPI000D3E135B|nr:transporter substrate-binding domain-containing protein [Dongshaea marina]
MLKILTWMVLIAFLPLKLTAKELSFATQQFAPFSFEIGGEIHGPMPEIVRSACELSKISCDLKLLPWPRAQKYVYFGVINGMFPIGWTEKRAARLYFSEPILSTEYGLFVKEDSKLVMTEKTDLSGLTIGAYGPSNTSRSLIKLTKDMKNVKLDITPHDEFPFKKLAVGRVDAVYSNKNVGEALIAKLGLNNIKYAGRHRTLDYYIGISKKHTDENLAREFFATIVLMKEKGVIRNILSGYTMDEALAK